MSGFRLPKRHTVSTWHERTESTSFTGRFVRLDPRLLLLSWSYAETYQSIFSTVLIFPFITLGTNFEEISYSISSGTFLKTKAEGGRRKGNCCIVFQISNMKCKNITFLFDIMLVTKNSFQLIFKLIFMLLIFILNRSSTE